MNIQSIITGIAANVKRLANIVGSVCYPLFKDALKIEEIEMILSRIRAFLTQFLGIYKYHLLIIFKSRYKIRGRIEETNRKLHNAYKITT